MYVNTTAVVCILNKQLTILGGYTSGIWTTPNPDASLTVIDGRSAVRCVLVQQTGSSAPTASLRMDGFTIRNGYAQGPSQGAVWQTFAFGGGMQTNAALIVLNNVTFQNNVVIGGSANNSEGGAGSGGGLALMTAPAGTSLTNVTFSGNRALGGAGTSRGGLAVGGGMYTYQSIAVGDHLNFTNNAATGGSSNGGGIGSDGLNADAQGGGLAGQSGSNLTLKHVVASGNIVTVGTAGGSGGGGFGGAIKGEWAAISLEDSSLTGNVAQGANGSNGGMGAGGGFESNDSGVTLNRVFVINNRASGGGGSNKRGAAAGGGISMAHFGGSSTVTIVNTVVASNLAELGPSGSTTGGGGGGIWLDAIDATMEQVTVAGNRLGSAPMEGQGIIVGNDGSSFTANVNLNYSIISDHTNSFGAVALHVKPGNTVNLNKGLWANNSKNTNSDGIPNTSGTFTGLGSMFSAASAGFTSPGSPNYDYRLTTGSAARNHAIGSSVPVDILSLPRVTPDIGAYEFQTMTYSNYLPIVRR
jgi:hypothetical protein